jgi:GT2 family glycosyltransferase
MNAAPPDLTVVIVSYNTRDLTLAALRTLFATTRRTSFEVVVLDNASSDGSADAVSTAFPQVTLHRSDRNLGFAKANNLVAASARTDWLLLLNPDTEVHEGAVDTLMDFARAHPEAGIWGGRTVFPDGRLNAGSCWMRITPWSTFCAAVGLTALFPQTAFFNPESMGSWQRDSIRGVDIVSGCFFLIRRDLWDRLGGFDLRYVMYGEEADLCLRARRFGARPMITPAAQIMHLMGASSSNAGRRALVAKARTTLIRDHWPAGWVPVGVGLMWIWAATRVLAARVLAPVTGERGRERAALWTMIWRTRHDWLKGY